MRKASLCVHKVYQNNEIFREDSHLNRDDCLAFFRELQTEFHKADVSLQTDDIHPPESADFVIYNEMPKRLPRSIELKNKSALLIFESHLIRPDNWDVEKHKCFSKIFTWNPQLVDNQKYFKMNFCGPSPALWSPLEEKSKLCVIISGNKRILHAKELYSERIKAIRWFEKYAPGDLDLYGTDWDLYTFMLPHLGKALNKIRILRKVFAKKQTLYRGLAANKHSVMRNYKFSICFENAKDIPGYITEKIFDSMIAGCIPVYLGAPDIGDHIPSDCYIQRDIFRNYQELHEYLLCMSDEEYRRRIAAIGSFLGSSGYEPFLPRFNASHVAKSILG